MVLLCSSDAEKLICLEKKQKKFQSGFLPLRKAFDGCISLARRKSQEKNPGLIIAFVTPV